MRFLNTLCWQNAEIRTVPAGVVLYNHFLSHLQSVFVCVYSFYAAKDWRLIYLLCFPFHMGRASSVGIATRHELDGPGIESLLGARFSAPVHHGPGAHPAFCTVGTWSFLGVKRPGRGADHPPPSMCRAHERVEQYRYCPSGLAWHVIGRNFTYSAPWRQLTNC